MKSYLNVTICWRQFSSELLSEHQEERSASSGAADDDGVSCWSRSWWWPGWCWWSDGRYFTSDTGSTVVTQSCKSMVNKLWEKSSSYLWQYQTWQEQLWTLVLVWCLRCDPPQCCLWQQEQEEVQQTQLQQLFSWEEVEEEAGARLRRRWRPRAWWWGWGWGGRWCWSNCWPRILE